MTDQEAPQAASEATLAPAPAQPRAPRDILGYLVLITGVGALGWGAVAAVGTGWGYWEYTSGLKGVAGAFLLGVAAILIGLVQEWRVRKSATPPLGARRWVGMLVALVYVGWVGTFLVKALTVPAIHDVSTDLADPPAFVTLQLRADNWDAVPGADDAKMRGLTPEQRWAMVHQKAYGDIRSVRVNEPVQRVVAKAERLAKARGWDVAKSLPAEGRLEATETSAFFQFKDDVVLRVRPSDTGEGSIVDMRSVSRVGQSDLGMNAKRVRSFLADLTGTVTAAQ
ncbi:DUF1499 domain-containing protein [Sphingorhabdus sp. EL138]|uniref:DUF1499 domain-containing protein n=1 Tax=Sphingorhabdus sp. EL138 TaxID=2073156 RepID=UPI0025EC004E|nr:DUF1499 domain-containing protein [Sphingorhabdus sp. EL138]